ncbi:PREDICTED: eclosion hormone-like, partial [Rhagoletis zephyria]
TISGIDFIQICLNNCAQCKKMFGDYFQGQTCAESCLKFKGKAIPDCEDIGSIAPFLNALE